MILKAICISEKTGTIKYPVENANVTIKEGIVGDAHGKKKDKQITILSDLSIKKFEEKIGQKISYGESAENLVVSELKVENCPIGTKIKIGDSVILEVKGIGKEIRDECPSYPKYKVCPTAEEGLFLKVLEGGKIKINDKVEILGA